MHKGVHLDWHKLPTLQQFKPRAHSRMASLHSQLPVMAEMAVVVTAVQLVAAQALLQTWVVEAELVVQQHKVVVIALLSITAQALILSAINPLQFKHNRLVALVEMVEMQCLPVSQVRLPVLLLWVAVAAREVVVAAFLLIAATLRVVLI